MFSENLHSWQEFYTTTGRTGRAKYQLCSAEATVSQQLLRIATKLSMTSDPPTLQWILNGERPCPWNIKTHFQTHNFFTHIVGSLCKHSKFLILDTQGITSCTVYTWRGLCSQMTQTSIFISQHTVAWTKQQMCWASKHKVGTVALSMWQHGFMFHLFLYVGGK